MLMMQDKQYSGVDYREVVIDDRTSTPLNQFSNIHDLMQWRVSRQSEELSYCTIDGRGREGKGVNWKKFDLKVAAVAMYMKNKVKVQPGDHLLLMYTHSEDFVYAVHACFCLGAIAIPMAPIDQNRLNEDAPALLHMLADFKIKAILCNNEVDHLMKVKAVSQHLKQSAMILRVNLPNIYNTAKPPKQSNGCRDLGLTIRPAWVQNGHPVLIWTYWTPDQRRIAVQLGHDTIMALCKVQKETCQMTSTRPVLGCVRSTIGLGFIHTCVMGIFLGMCFEAQERRPLTESSCTNIPCISGRLCTKSKHPVPNGGKVQNQRHLRHKPDAGPCHGKWSRQSNSTPRAQEPDDCNGWSTKGRCL
jgi:hypothetical protein